MKILQKQDLEDILFLDIETAPAEEELTPDSPLWDAWEYKCIKEGEEDIAGSFQQKAGLYGEFGKIVCITIAIVREGKIRLKTFSGDERELLEEFTNTLDGFVNNKTWLCGHVITEFDGPFIMKRCLVNRVKLNMLFDVAHLKPWEVSYLDTANLWKGTSFKRSSLISLTACLGLPSPKDDISGADVGRLYYEGDIDRIIKYCEKDVIALVDIVRALRYEEPLVVAEPEEEIEDEPLGVLDYLWGGGEYTKEIAGQLKGAISKMNKTDKGRALEILNALPSRAKGKVTFITKKDIKELFNE